MLRKFASLGHSSEFAYAFDSQAFDMKAPMHDHFRMFHTYGDDLCQHSGDWPVQVEFITDYLISLAVAMQTDEELLDGAKYALSNRPHVNAIQFAATVLWKDDGKRRYFSVNEAKISSSPSKQYDKRYQEITDIHDGSPKSIYRILIAEHSDGIQKYSYASAIRDWVLAHPDRGWMELPGQFLQWSKDRDDARKLYEAYESCWNLVQSYQFRHMANVGIENYKRSLTPPVAQSDAA